jgi:hypothetical protein
VSRFLSFLGVAVLCEQAYTVQLELIALGEEVTSPRIGTRIKQNKTKQKRGFSAVSPLKTQSISQDRLGTTTSKTPRTYKRGACFTGWKVGATAAGPQKALGLSGANFTRQICCLCPLLNFTMTRSGQKRLLSDVKKFFLVLKLKGAWCVFENAGPFSAPLFARCEKTPFNFHSGS